MQYIFAFCQDLPVRPRRPERLFFALFPDAATSARIAGLGERIMRENRLEGTRIGRQRLHLSLHHVGDYARLPSRFTYAARLAGDSVAMPRFRIAFDRVGSFEATPARGRRSRAWPLVLRGEADALSKLHAALGAAMAANGLKAAAHFSPHITLSYASRAIPERSIAPVRFEVGEFALVHSMLGLLRYEVIARWPLDG